MDIRRLLKTAPVQERFGPSLPQLIVPRIDRLPVIARAVGAVVVLVLVVAAVIVTLVPRSSRSAFTHRGPPATFKVTWRSDLTHEPTPPGALLLLDQHDASGLVASFEVTPLRLPRYSGEVSGLLPVVAINYEYALEQRYGQAVFTPWSLGRTRIVNTPAFTFSYSRIIHGVTYFGRFVFITPDLSGDRSGLLLSLLQRADSLAVGVSLRQPTPDFVGTRHPLQEPLVHLRIS
jgi:hypothetical protein